ncbi:hypothetical protein GCM10008965_25200 [Methylorubrum aminovorans]|nr:hypothetical protein GCM10025880_33080 [Methylorubrum aminovorans]
MEAGERLLGVLGEMQGFEVVVQLAYGALVGAAPAGAGFPAGMGAKVNTDKTVSSTSIAC